MLQNPSRFHGLPRAALREWLDRVLQELAADADSLTVRFVGDPEMRALNRGFRGRDATTDVLSFPGERTIEGYHLGDIVISVPVARRQATGSGGALEPELRRLLLHGLLHCLGHDHEADGGVMERLERRLRRRWVERE